MAVLDPFNINVLKSSCGYIDTFIDGSTSISIDGILNSGHRAMLTEVAGNKNKLLKYTMLSVWYNAQRKVPFVSAYNIDGTLKKETVARANFKADPRIDGQFQLNNDFYDLIRTPEPTEFEIGHMASHNEMSWGLNRKVQAHQTFHFTNSVPQVEKLNSGLWSKLESYVIAETGEADNKRISVFTGPMLKDDDPTYVKDRSFQLPLYFFKIVVFPFESVIYSTAFVMSQLKRLQELELIDTTERGFEKAELVPRPFSDYNHRDVFQVDIDLVETYTGLSFSWPQVERIVVPNMEKKLEKISRTGGRTATKAFEGLERLKGKPVLTNMVLPSR